jgi:hypothetical protein
MKLAFLLAATVVRLVAQSDVELERDELVRFRGTKGASHVGRDVRWDVPAKSLSLPVRTQGGMLLFVHEGVGIVVPEGSAELAEVRRRGGFAVVRGRIRAWPGKERRPGDPAHILVARSLAYRRGSRPKK